MKKFSKSPIFKIDEDLDCRLELFLIDSTHLLHQVGKVKPFTLACRARRLSCTQRCLASGQATSLQFVFMIGSKHTSPSPISIGLAL